MEHNIDDALPVSPSVIKWARQRAGFSAEDAEKSFKKIAAWEAGLSFPSYPQLEQMGEKFKCPVAVFFFPEPPDMPSVEKSFRTLTAQDFEKIPRTVRGFLRKGQAMQLNLAELNDGKNPAARLITRDLKFQTNTSLDGIANSIRTYLGISLQEQSSWNTVEIALEKWRDAFASVGIYVFKDAFQANEYFGFCLWDDEFPIIYINNSCAKSRQIFTLFHELWHLLFHTSGIDISGAGNTQHLKNNEQKVEIVCNQLAARFLIPEDDFAKLLVGKPANRATAELLAKHFNVSREAIYRKLLDRDRIDASEYEAASIFWTGQIKRNSSQGNYYNSQISYLGSNYINLALKRYYQRRFDEVKLSDYLNIKPKNLPAFELKYGGG